MQGVTIFCIGSPGSGDVVDEALRNCSTGLGEYIILMFFLLFRSQSLPLKYPLLYSPLRDHKRFHPYFDSDLDLCFLSPPGRCNPPMKELQVSMGLRLLLPCVQLSAWPCSWEHPPHRHTRQHNSDLEVTVTEDSLGKYICTCQVKSGNVRLLHLDCMDFCSLDFRSSQLSPVVLKADNICRNLLSRVATKTTVSRALNKTCADPVVAAVLSKIKFLKWNISSSD